MTVSNLWVTEIHVANCLLKGWTLKTSPPTLLSFCMFFAWENDSVQRSYCLVLLSCLKSLRWHSWTLTFRFSTLRSCKVTLCWRKSSANFEVFKSELFVCLFTHGHNFPCFFPPPKNQKQNTKTSFFCGLVVAIRVSSWSPFGLWWPLCACWCLYPFPLLLSPEGQMFTFNTADKELPIFTVSASRERPEQRDDYHLAF